LTACSYHGPSRLAELNPLTRELLTGVDNSINPTNKQTNKGYQPVLPW